MGTDDLAGGTYVMVAARVMFAFGILKDHMALIPVSIVYGCDIDLE